MYFSIYFLGFDFVHLLCGGLFLLSGANLIVYVLHESQASWVVFPWLWMVVCAFVCI